MSNGNYAVTIDGGSASLTNTIVASHTVGFSGVGIAADHTLFFNTDGLCSAGASCPNSVSGDPGFTNPEAGDFHIRPDSAAIDAGINTGVSADIDGEPRFGNPDVGADEYWAPGSLMRIYLPLVRR